MTDKEFPDINAQTSIMQANSLSDLNDQSITGGLGL
jgi:hypothetical protein